jgi:hypothetical protein
MTEKKMLDITPSPRLLQVLGDIPLQPWQCLAELVDNSLDELVKQPSRTIEDPLVVDISIEEGQRGETFLVVSDNGFGMSVDELEQSLRAGHSAKNRYGTLGLFGMGFNIATARLGNVTSVLTTQRGMKEMLQATIDFADIQGRESFSVPLVRLPTDEATAGTTVKVQLKRDMVEVFRRPATKRTLLSQLGDVYSFLLREEVPGISAPGMSSRIPARLVFNGDLIEPRLPCVWADTRSVTSYGQEVKAVQYIDVKLTEATACLTCGYWDRKNGPEVCEECGSTNLELRARRIWGWLGIQRFIDSSSYGVDFIRYGRKILKQDKSIFTFTDPDTLQSDAEYPIEMPANQGRIVGEIHLDHVPVTYQKNDFDRQSFDWQKAIECIRGGSPLKPGSRGTVNTSPLAKLYSAFRRNDPGLRYLTPGDGKTALHTKAREWGANFEKGIARFREDTEWYRAAELHDQANKEAKKKEEENGEEKKGAKARLIGADEPTSTTYKKKDDAPLSVHERLARARTVGTRREDLSGTFNLGKSLGTWEISVIATRETLSDEHGRVVPAIAGMVKGTAIEVLVSSEHAIFREFGRDIRDVALLQAANMIRDLAASDISVASAYAELVLQISDLRVSTPALLERIERTLERVRKLCLPIVSQDPESFWSLLTSAEKQRVEEASALALSTTSMSELVGDGRFILYCAADTLSKIIEQRCMVLFDGLVFRPSLRHRPSAARERLVGTVVRALLALHGFREDDLLRQKHDMQLVQLSLDLLDDQMVGEELLS